MQDLGTLLGYTYECSAEAINDAGLIVGYSASTGGVNSQAFVYSGGSMENLNNLIGTSQWDLQTATGVNDLGEICGCGINPSGQTDAYLLTPNPIPEPSTLSLLGSAVLGLGAVYLRRRRQRHSLSLTRDTTLSNDDEAPAILSMPSRWTEARQRAA